MNRGRLNRGDLLLARAAVTEEKGLSYIANICGFAKATEAIAPPLPDLDHFKQPLPPPPPDPPTTEPPSDGVFELLLPVSYIPLADETMVHEMPRFAERAIRRDELEAKQMSVRFEPLVPWHRLWPYLRFLLSGFYPGRTLDVPRLVDDFARLRFTKRLPVRKQRRWGPRAQIWVDSTKEMGPFQNDPQFLIERLRRFRGEEGLSCFNLPEGPVLKKALNVATRERGFPPSPEPGEAILLLSPLGTTEPRHIEDWADLGRQLLAQGARLFSLVPMAVSRVDAQLARLWNCSGWDRNVRFTEKGSTEASVPASREALETQVEALVEALSVALRIEPPLLRELRLALPGASAEAEYVVWFHREMKRISQVCAPSFDAGAKNREAFKDRNDEQSALLKEKLVDALEHHHQGLSMALRAEEMRNCREVGLDTDERTDWEIDGVLDKCNQALADAAQGATGDSDVIQGLEGFLTRKVYRLSTKERRNDASLARGLAVLDWSRSYNGAPPEGIDYETYRKTVRELHRAGKPIVKFASYIKGESVVLAPRGDDEAKAQPIGLLPAASPQAIVVPKNGWPGTAKIETDTAALDLESRPPPPWADCYAWDRHGIYTEFEIKKARFKLRWIPPGSFKMGSPEDELGRRDTEGPVHRVVIKEGFWLGETPVTQGQYEAVIGENPSDFKDSGPNAPVEQVNWHQARAFCDAMSVLLAGLDENDTFRLPSEAEWEYACRAGSEGPLYHDKPLTSEMGQCPNLDELAWYRENSGSKTHPVKEKLVNPWGLYDMLGNVLEWCEDQWHSSYESAPVDGSAWVDDAEEGRFRVIRGGGWIFDAGGCRAAYRNGNAPDARWSLHGFRLVLAPSKTGGIPPFEQENGGARSDFAAPRAEPGPKRPKSDQGADGLGNKRSKRMGSKRMGKKK